MRRFALAFLVLLAGCADLAQYKPYVTDVSDPALLASDEADCLARATAYKTPLSSRSIFSAAGQGASINAAAGAISPLGPLLGGAGYATAELLSELGLLSTAQRKVFLICLAHRGERSRAYDVLDPNQ